MRLNEFDIKFKRLEANGDVVFRPVTIGDNKTLHSHIKKNDVDFRALKVSSDLRTLPQIRLIHALIRDINELDGGFVELKKHELKTEFCYETGLDYFSLKDCSKEIAKMFISWLVEYCFRYDLDFNGKDLHTEFNINQLNYYCSMTKRCFATMARAIHVPLHIHHVNAIGRGSRKKADHRGRYYMILRASLHDDIHRMGFKKFCELRHTGAIKFSDELILKYKLMSQSQMSEIDADPTRVLSHLKDYSADGSYEIKSFELAV